MVDPNNGSNIFLQPFNQPFSNASSGPVFARARWWLNFNRNGVVIGHIDAQPLEAGGWSLGAGIVDADIAAECRAICVHLNSRHC